MSKKMLNRLLLLGVFISLIVSVSFVSAQAPYPLRRNDDAATLSGQANTSPMWGGVTGYGEVYIAPKPGMVRCSSINTGTTATTIISSINGISHVVYRVNCVNTSAVASTIGLNNAASSVGYGYVGTTTLGNNSYNFEFPNPIKINGSTALTFTMGTTSTSTVCCANYLDVPNTTPTLTVTPTATNTPTATPTP